MKTHFCDGEKDITRTKAIVLLLFNNTVNNIGGFHNYHFKNIVR